MLPSPEKAPLKIRTSDIPTAWLTAHCRNLIAKYALLAYQINKTMFDLRSDKILAAISNHASSNDSPELDTIYRQLKEELKAILASPSRKSALISMAEKSDYLNDNFSH